MSLASGTRIGAYEISGLLGAGGMGFTLDADRLARFRREAQLRHPVRPGQLVVPIHPGKEIPWGTAASLLKAAGLK